MFDDQPINNNQIPSNLPVGKAEDIFAGTDEDIPVAKDNSSDLLSSIPSPKSTSMPIHTAAGVGKLQTKQNIPQSTSGAIITNPPLGEDIFAKEPKLHIMPGSKEDLNKIKGPGLAKNLMIFFIILVGFAILGGGSWLVYSLFVKGDTPAPLVDEVSDFDSVDTKDEKMEVTDINDEAIFMDDIVDPNDSMIDSGQDGIEDRIMEDEVLFGEPVDTDSDNLSDDIELEIGLNPDNWDSDHDGLGDGDEVLVWKSNPLKSDTDGDGFPDGAEVKNGYSPIGPGRIFDLGQ